MIIHLKCSIFNIGWGVFKVTELGKALREARKAKGLSIDDIQELTKIQKRYLEAIEEENYKILPGQFYVKAFIRQYAEVVGVDESEFAVPNNTVVTQEIVEKEEVEPIKPIKEEIPSRSTKTTREPINVKESPVMEYLPRILIGVLVIGIIAIVWMIVPNNSGKNVKNNPSQSSNPVVEKPKNNPLDQKTKDTQQKETQTTDQTQGTVQPTTPSEQVLTVASTTRKKTTIEVSKNQALKVDITAKGGISYLAIKNELGKSFFANNLNDGQTQSFDFTNENEVILNVGATQNVEIRVNGEVLQLPSKSPHQHITIKNVK